MKRKYEWFFNIKKELEWMSAQKGWKLIKTNGFCYTFEESESHYHYEYIYFEKSSKELDEIMKQITDKDVEFVCNTFSWALFRKDSTKGAIRIYEDAYVNYKRLMTKSNSYLALGACYLCLGTSQMAITNSNGLFGFTALLFYLCSALFNLKALQLRKYSSSYDDGTFAVRLKKKL